MRSAGRVKRLPAAMMTDALSSTVATPAANRGLRVMAIEAADRSAGTATAKVITRKSAARRSSRSAVEETMLPSTSAPPSPPARTIEPAMISSSQPPEELPSAPVPQSSSQPQQQDQQAQQTQTPQQPPVGTAAAPYEKPTGVPGSRPAGAAIAPAKQRRVRAIVISLGLVLAGAGAIGAVAGMSKASHSTP